MTLLEHLMLSCCFGATMGVIIAGIGWWIADFFRWVREKIRKRREGKEIHVAAHRRDRHD